uniref:Dephospho-CoA kinase n=1 Tax=Odontella aurita TaxID=265563 RepID=A0A7S4M4I7_9STRA|mmetsp:Transcript_10565/g.31128  ORF Transcript_10565/g.31128 Transcript_10565/m.31128 type:complete len:352 (+) Transcript_10565:149-1204(+)
MARKMLFALGTGVFFTFPTGFVIGILTERAALRPPIGKAFFDVRLWNASVKTAIAAVATQVLRIASNLGGEQVDRDSDASFAFATWVICFCAGARLGSALQPVGLTGGIACGKSTVAKMLMKSKGARKDAFAVVDTDSIAHDILLPNKMGVDSAYHKIIATFGDGVLEEEGSKDEGGQGVRTIDRRVLGDIIFRDPSKRRKLNAITHPLITKVMLKQIVRESLRPSREGTSVVSVDIPLLYEVGYPLRLLVGLEVVVACTPSVQLERLMRRNRDLTRDQCKERIESQTPIDRKVELADFVVRNDGSVENLEQEVDRMRKGVLSRVNGWGFTLPKLVVAFGLVVAVWSELLI